jgi:hypothetical protein
MVITRYDTETGEAAEDGSENTMKIPLFLATTYFIAKLSVLPFVGWKPDSIPMRLYAKIFMMTVLGAIGGILEYASYQYCPVSVIVMIRVGGLVSITALQSAYITRRSVLGLKTSMALGVVILGTVFAAWHHSEHEDWSEYAVLGISLTLLSTLADSTEQVVQEDILQDEEFDLDVFTFTAVSGLCGSSFMIALLACAQFIPGQDTGGVLENTVRTMQVIFSSGILTGVLIILLGMVIIDMVAASALAKSFGATTKEAVLSFRIIAAWLSGTILFLVLPGYGEAWPWSELVLKAIGGTVIIAGVFLYVQYRREEEEESGRVTAED